MIVNKRFLKSIAVVNLISLFLLSGSLSIANAAGTTSKRETVFNTVSTQGCVEKSVELWVTNLTNPLGITDFVDRVDVRVSQRDICAGGQLMNRWTASSRTPNDTGLTRKLTSAAYKQVLQGFESVSQTNATVTVDLQWTGVGSIRKGSGREACSIGTCNYSALARDAVVSGSIVAQSSESALFQFSSNTGGELRYTDYTAR